MSMKEGVGAGIMGLAWIAASILGLVIHVWTIVIAFMLSGLVGAVITLILPVLAQAYWFFKVGASLGFGTTYCVAIMAYVGLLVVAVIGAAIAGSES